MNDEIQKVYDQVSNNEANAKLLIQQKENEIFHLTNKINDLEATINRYGTNLNGIKSAYDQAVLNHKRDLVKKQEETRVTKENYDKNIKEVFESRLFLASEQAGRGADERSTFHTGDE